MSKNPDESNEQAATSQSVVKGGGAETKKPYSPPSLTTYGKVEDRTKGIIVVIADAPGSAGLLT